MGWPGWAGSAVLGGAFGFHSGEGRRAGGAEYSGDAAE